MRADTGVERDRTGNRYNAKIAETKEPDRKRTDGFVEVLGRGVSSLYYQNISTRDQGVSSGYLLSDIHNKHHRLKNCKLLIH